MVTGFIFNIQKYSIHDGPGIRTTVFLKGCPLRCRWCHNPEGQSTARDIFFAADRCIRCGACLAVCPQAQDAPAESLPSMDRSRCIRCGACVDVCMAGARRSMGMEMTVDEVLAEILQDRIFYADSGGGVTLSGGEPLMQPEFSKALLQACRQEGIHTAIDTCGHAPKEVILALAPWTDLFLYDIKLMDPIRHRAWTGVSNMSLLDNLVALGHVHPNIWIRIPIVPGVNDTVPDARQIADFVAGIGGIQRIVLLPYHESANHKAEQLGIPIHRLEPNQALGNTSLERLSEPFRARGLAVQMGG